MQPTTMLHVTLWLCCCCMQHLCNWGNDGLRTLVFAMRELEPSYFQSWAKKYDIARADLDELTKRKNKKKNAIDDLMNGGCGALTRAVG